MKTILSLCDFSGVWSKPYRDAGYEVIQVDKAFPEQDATHLRWDLTFWWEPIKKPWGVIAAPPCTCFCRPAARWWSRQDASGQTQNDVDLFRHCLRICRLAEGWWALENPPGRHRKLIPELGRPAWQYHPWEYGDPWGKQTYIWGTAVKPPVTNPVAIPPTRRTPNGHTQGRIAWMSGAWKRQREQTPAGFARAFFLANP